MSCEGVEQQHSPHVGSRDGRCLCQTHGRTHCLAVKQSLVTAEHFLLIKMLIRCLESQVCLVTFTFPLFHFYLFVEIFKRFFTEKKKKAR